MSEAPVRLGLLSTAGINRFVLSAAAVVDTVEVVAVASRDADRARTYAEERGIPRWHGTYEALFADDDVDAVYIGVPNALHVQSSLQALEAGKHVLCEKPLTRHPEDVDRAFDVADRVGRVLMEGFMWRHHPQTKRLVELVEDGSIGELRLVRSAFSFPLTELGNIRLRADLEGGALMDVGCYCVSASRLLAGEPEQVAAVQLVGPSGVDVRFSAAMLHPGAVVSHFDCALDLPNRSELEAIGSDGSIRVSDPWHAGQPELEVRLGEMVERIEIEPTEKFGPELENFAAAIAGTAAPLLGRADAAGQARALAALYADAEARATG